MKLADYSDRVTADQLDTALRLGGFEGVFHYLSGTPGYVIRVEDPAVVADIRSRGWPQVGIDTPTLAGLNGTASAARVRDVYGFGDGFRHYLDIEPSQFNANPGAWPSAADGWCDAVRAAGLSPGIYGTDQTLAACANHADSIWRIEANTGSCDAAAPGIHGLNPAFFAGRRIVQCNSASYNGVNFDVNFSQFNLGVTLEEDMPIIIGAPNRPAFLLDGKLWVGIADANDLAILQAAGVKAAIVSAALFDAINTAQTTMPAVGTVNVDLSPMTSRQDAINKHLGVGTP